jgi:hypothetical protein
MGSSPGGDTKQPTIPDPSGNIMPPGQTAPFQPKYFNFLTAPGMGFDMGLPQDINEQLAAFGGQSAMARPAQAQAATGGAPDPASMRDMMANMMLQQQGLRPGLKGTRFEGYVRGPTGGYRPNPMRNMIPTGRP